MAKDKYYGKTLRKNFARHEEVMAMPNLLEIQKRSYKWFLETGLREVFADVASITDYAGNLELSFIDYSMDEKPKYDVEECKARDATYAAPMKGRVRLHNKETGEIKEQEIFMGDFPLMTHGGTFVINGAERVVVSQIVRSPGVYYGKEIDLKTDLPLLTSTVIPYRGAWLEYETDTSEVFWVRIDKNRKLPITCLIRALGLKTDGEILERFGDDRRIVATLEKDTCKTYEEALLEIYRKLRPGEPPTVDSAETLLQGLFFDPRRYDLSMVGRYKFNKKLTIWSRAKGQKLAMPVANPATGEIIFEDGHVLTAADCAELDAVGVYEITVALESGETLKIFTNKMCDMSRYVDFDPKEQCGIKERVRFDVLQELLGQYSGEELIAQCRLHADELVPKHIIVDDIFASINYMNALARGLVNKDDIDHLGNRRLRCVGELLQNQFRIGFSRMERVIRERMTIQDLDIVTPQSLINIRPVTAAIKEFFGSSPLSQFMDQTNPLAELTHKRRLSALGPGGLSRDRAGFEVRDVHYSHYGRMCPIETPEGPNIGLISYLATFARINEYGFVEAPYRPVDKATGKVLDTNVVYPVPEFKRVDQAKKTIKSMVLKNEVEVMAIGNGTAGHETEEFAAAVIRELAEEKGLHLQYMVVSEAGASLYSASKLAAEEFPQYDVNLRSAVSIARGLQDPLAELVKIDPKAVGVGQYQHDMPQKRLNETLDGVVEDCVNSVGVDLNTASAPLLARVAGITNATALAPRHLNSAQAFCACRVPRTRWMQPPSTPKATPPPRACWKPAAVTPKRSARTRCRACRYG